jgi:hypothetical protein
MSTRTTIRIGSKYASPTEYDNHSDSHTTVSKQIADVEIEIHAKTAEAVRVRK